MRHYYVCTNDKQNAFGILLIGAAGFALDMLVPKALRLSAGLRFRYATPKGALRDPSQTRRPVSSHFKTSI